MDQRQPIIGLISHMTCFKTKGFTLVEVILYVALLVIFMVGVVTYAWNGIGVRIKARTQQEVIDNLRLVNKRILFEIRNANNITTVTPTSLTLANTDAIRNPTVIDLSGGRVRIGWGSGGSCPTSSPCFLTSSAVTVTDLLFTNMTGGGSISAKFFVAMKAVNPGGTTDYDFKSSYSGAAEVRSH